MHSPQAGDNYETAVHRNGSTNGEALSNPLHKKDSLPKDPSLDSSHDQSPGSSPQQQRTCLINIEYPPETYSTPAPPESHASVMIVPRDPLQTDSPLFAQTPEGGRQAVRVVNAPPPSESVAHSSDAPATLHESVLNGTHTDEPDAMHETSTHESDLHMATHIRTELGQHQLIMRQRPISLSPTAPTDFQSTLDQNSEYESAVDLDTTTDSLLVLTDDSTVTPSDSMEESRSTTSPTPPSPPPPMEILVESRRDDESSKLAPIAAPAVLDPMVSVTPDQAITEVELTHITDTGTSKEQDAKVTITPSPLSASDTVSTETLDYHMLDGGGGGGGGGIHHSPPRLIPSLGSTESAFKPFETVAHASPTTGTISSISEDAMTTGSDLDKGGMEPRHGKTIRGMNGKEKRVELETGALGSMETGDREEAGPSSSGVGSGVARPVIDIRVNVSAHLQPSTPERVADSSEQIFGSFLAESYRLEVHTTATTSLSGPLGAAQCSASAHAQVGTHAPVELAPQSTTDGARMADEFARIPHSEPGSNEERIARRLAQIGDEVDRTYGHVLDEMIKRLPRDACPVDQFSKVAHTLFSDGTNWGRVIALLCFGYRLVIRRIGSGLLSAFRQVFSALSTFCTQFNLFGWIANQGGWLAVQYFTVGRSQPAQPNHYGLLSLTNQPVLTLSVLGSVATVLLAVFLYWRRTS